MFDLNTTVWIKGFIYNYLDLFFTSQRKSHSVLDTDFLYYTFTNFASIKVIKDRVTKIKSKCFNGEL